MVATGMNEIADVWGRIDKWSSAQKLALMRKILDSLDVPSNTPAQSLTTGAGLSNDVVREPRDPGRSQADVGSQPRKKTLADLLGLFHTDAAPPNDEEVERILEEERMRKYG
jgi:hypothetical protein